MGSVCGEAPGSVLDPYPVHLRQRLCARFCKNPGGPGTPWSGFGYVYAEVVSVDETFAIHACPECGQKEFVPVPGAFPPGEMEAFHGELPGPDLSLADEHDWRL